MWIFDRWGEKIFYTDDIQKGWNGKVQGRSAEGKQEVYVWKVRLKDVFGKSHQYIGHVTLLK
jgi:gliding motility-associated-like protein